MSELEKLTMQWLDKVHPDYVGFKPYVVDSRDPYHPMAGQCVVQVWFKDKRSMELKLGTTYDDAIEFLKSVLK